MKTNCFFLRTGLTIGAISLLLGAVLGEVFCYFGAIVVAASLLTEVILDNGPFSD